ncbi:MAG: disulfide bond formation protein B, partial [Deltaproteobacteria bacterium]|nr:disulfide bond formation protein B [Deltaproteobacteria bacterium]
MSGVALNYPYLNLVDQWRRGRPLWLAGALLSVGLELFSVLYFQKGLGLKPCLYCVYIREAIILIALGSLWAAICPSLGFFRILGHLVSLAGSFLVLFFSFKLETLNVIAKYWPDEYVSCGAR